MNEKEELIYDAALTLFVENGFSAVTTAKISKTAGVATGTLFNYFPTKDGLIFALYYRCRESVLSNISQRIDFEKSPEENLRIFLGDGFRYKRENPREFIYLLQFHYSPFLSKMSDVSKDTLYLSDVFEVIKIGIAKGDFKDLDPKIMLQGLFGVAGAIDWYAIVENHDFSDDIFDQVIEIMVDSIKKHK